MNPWLYVLPYFPIIITGSWSTLLISLMAYITDSSDEKDRSTRLAIMETITFSGILLGMASCSFALKLTSELTVFAVSAALASFAAINAFIFIEESLDISQNNLNIWDQLTELFSPKPVVEALKTCFKKRPHNERRIIWFLILILILVFSCMTSTGNVIYLFTRGKFNWSLKEFTIFQSSSFFMTIMGNLIGLMIFKRLLSFPDIAIAAIAILSLFAESIIKATAHYSTEMYFAVGICLFKSLAIPMCRSLIASIIPKTEIGKIYSIASTLESVSSVITAPLYTFVYAKTFIIYAGAFFFITSSFALLSLILIFYINRMLKDRQKLLTYCNEIFARNVISKKEEQMNFL